MRHDGTENLVPITERSEEEQRAMRIKAGQASGKARRKKKELKKLLELALSQPCNDGSGEDNWTQICAAQIQRALEGDTKAFVAVRDTIGQKPVEEIKADVIGNTNINITIED